MKRTVYMLSLSPPSSGDQDDYSDDYHDGLRNLRYVRTVKSNNDLMLCDESEAEIFTSLKVVERLAKCRLMRLPSNSSIRDFSRVRVIRNATYYDLPSDLVVLELEVDTCDFSCKV